MTKLQKLYNTIQNLKELGLELGGDLLRQLGLYRYFMGLIGMIEAMTFVIKHE